MKIEIIKDEKGANFLSKITGILFGIFLTSLIFLFSIKLLEEIGIYLGLILNIIIIFLGFYYTKKRSTLRMITWGMLILVLIGIAFYISGLIMITNLLKGF